MTLPGGHLARVFLLLLLSLGIFLPGIASLPPTDRDESRFAQATRQMVETGDYVDIRFQDVPRYKKPVGIYWLQAASVAVVGEGAASPIWVYRLPSMIASMLAVLLLYGFARRFAGEDIAFAAAALLAAALVLNIEARLAKTDATLLFTVVGALGCFGLIYQRLSEGLRTAPWLALAGWAFLGLGVLIKGPIAPLVAGLAVLTLAFADRRTGRVGTLLRALRPLPGVLVLALITAPWLIAISLKTDGAFLSNSVGGDLVPKLLGGEESHGAPPGYYFVTMAAMLWPGGVLFGLSLPWAWANRHRPWVRFALAWGVPGFILFELVPTKLPHYTMPYFPAFLLLGAGAALEAFEPVTRLGINWRRFVLGVFAAVGLALGLGLAGLEWYFAGGPGTAGLAAVVVALLTVTASLILLNRAAVGRAIAVMVIGAGALYAAAFTAILPGASMLWPAPALAAELDRLGLGSAPVLISSGYSEPSLVFLTRTDIRLLSPAEAAAAFAADPGAVALIEAGARPAFDAALGSVAAQDLGHVRAINISRGKPVDIAILRRRPSAP
jgi:4-amino-4-deoxy-L-arabinose transferase-like glycosyltransferase